MVMAFTLLVAVVVVGLVVDVLVVAGVVVVVVGVVVVIVGVLMWVVRVSVVSSVIGTGEVSVSSVVVNDSVVVGW